MRPRFTIGPPRFGRGKQTSVDALSGTSGSFNGATAFQPWKDADDDWRSDTAIVLQWGHGVSAVERRSPPCSPPPSVELQWGHGVSAVESFRCT